MGRFVTELVFKANTEQAKQALENLKTSLSQLSSYSVNSTGTQALTTEMIKAKDAAAQLKLSLDAATNVNTGKLSLGKFNQELKASGMTLQDYRIQLQALGTDGLKSFQQLTDSILQADQSLSVGSKLAKSFMTTLGNVAKYQLSTRVYQGFVSALQTAYSYAQELNESLNDIRIVTQDSADAMDKFAAKANKQAKNLSTTTNAYTRAALIFYQQGLSDADVEKRTATTLKLANVMGSTASEVSDYMTAIWNNFDNGSKSLEYYADVLTALGAATASSSEEIATGLEKFSAVAETVGLSYEYATAALATVTAQTRQSAETVGTAFKTIFARMQDLELGNSVDDGTTLGQYSEALKAVGVNVKDLTTGQMKDMDTILNELGAKWDNLSTSTKTATAQAVAGTRQYTQLIALMDNWDAFKSNVTVAETAEGTLDEQADIYAESWEAASKRVKAAAETIYSSLLDDKFFIKITNGFEKILTVLGSFIDGIGGLKGMLPIVTALMMKFAGPQVINGIQQAGNAIKNMVPAFNNESFKQIGQAFNGWSDKTGRQKAAAVIQTPVNVGNALFPGQTIGDKQANHLRAEAVEQEQLMIDALNRQGTASQAKAKYSQEELTLRQQLLTLMPNLTKSEQELYQNELDRVASLNEEVVKTKELVEEQQRVCDLLKEEVIQQVALQMWQRRWDKDSFTDEVSKYHDALATGVDISKAGDATKQASKLLNPSTVDEKVAGAQGIATMQNMYNGIQRIAQSNSVFNSAIFGEGNTTKTNEILNKLFIEYHTNQTSEIDPSNGKAVQIHNINSNILKNGLQEFTNIIQRLETFLGSRESSIRDTLANGNVNEAAINEFLQNIKNSIYTPAPSAPDTSNIGNTQQDTEEYNKVKAIKEQFGTTTQVIHRPRAGDITKEDNTIAALEAVVRKPQVTDPNKLAPIKNDSSITATAAVKDVQTLMDSLLSSGNKEFASLINNNGGAEIQQVLQTIASIQPRSVARDGTNGKITADAYDFNKDVDIKPLLEGLNKLLPFLDRYMSARDPNTTSPEQNDNSVPVNNNINPKEAKAQYKTQEDNFISQIFGKTSTRIPQQLQLVELANAQQVEAENVSAIGTQFNSDKGFAGQDPAYIEQLNQAIKAYNETCIDFEDQITNVTNASIELEETLKKIAQAQTVAHKRTAQVNTALKASVQGNKELTKTVNQFITAQNQETIKKIKSNKEARNAAAANKNLSKTLKDAEKKTTSISNVLGKGIQALSSFASAIKMIKGLGSIWKNEDLSTGEKLISTFTSLGMIVPMLSSGFSGLSSSAMSLAGALGTANSTTALGNALLLKRNEAQIQTILSNEALSEEEKKQQLVQLLGLENDALKKRSLKDLNKETLASIVATKIQTTTQGKGIIATLGQAAADFLLQTSLTPVLAITLLLAIAMFALAIVILIVVKAINAIVKAYNADSREMELNNSLLEAQKERVNELKTAYDELKQSIEDYSDTQDALDTMVEGTTAWKEALAEANAEVLELIEEYPELAQYVSTDTNGRMTIDEDSLVKVQQDALEKYQEGLATQYSLTITANDSTLESHTTDLKRKINSGKISNEDLKKIYQYYADNGESMFSSDTAYTTAIESIFGEHSSEYTALANLDEELIKTLKELCVEGKEITTSSDALTTSLIAAKNADNKDYQNGDTAVINALAAHDIDTLTDAAEKDAQTLWENSTGDRDEFWTEYLKALGYDEEDIGKTVKITQGGTGLFGNKRATLQTYSEDKGWVKDASGKNGITFTNAVTTIANHNAAELSDDQIAGYQKTSNKNKAQLKLIDGLTDDEIDTLNLLYAQAGDSGTIDLSSLSRATLTIIENNIDNITDETMKAALTMGIEGYDNARQEAIKQAQEDWLDESQRSETYANEKQKAIENIENFDTADFTDYAKQWEEDYDDYADDIAIANLKAENSFNKLNTAFSENAANLVNSKKGTIEYTDAVNNMLTAINGFLNGVTLDEEDLNAVAANLGIDQLTLFSKLAQGDLEALKALQTQAAKAYIIDLDVTDDTQSTLDDLINNIKDGNMTSENIATINRLMTEGQLSQDQAKQLLNYLGYAADEAEWTAEGLLKSVLYTNDLINLDTSQWELASQEDIDALMDELDRFRDINDEITRQQTLLSRISTLKEKAYGASKVRLLKKEQAELQNEIKLQKQYQTLAERYLASDKTDLIKKANEVSTDILGEGFTLKFDDNGAITNYVDLMEQLIEKQQTLTSIGADTTDVEDAISSLKRELEDYTESLDAANEAIDNQIEKQAELQDSVYETYTTILEYDLSEWENDLTLIDYYIDKLSDDIYKAAEAIAQNGSKISNTLDQLSTRASKLNINTNGEITGLIGVDGEVLTAATVGASNYAEALQEAYDAMVDDLSTLNELDQTMMDYYGDTLELAEEELSQYTEELEACTTGLEHYQDILNTIGEEKNYAKQLTVLRGIAETQKNSYESSLAYYNMLSAQRQEIEDKYNEAVANGQTEAVELYKEQLDDIKTATNEAYDDMLSKAQSYAESLKNTLTTALEAAQSELEDDLTSGLGFDAITDSLTKLKTAQDLVYTKTNQLYETNKMMNTIAQAIEKTDNKAAKEKYAAFNNEIKQLQNKETLSKVELSLAQAKYKVLEAQIALEEAQNAKPTVRLQRDSEGNYGYVYTADDSKVADAEQKLADAENNLYNVQLNAQNESATQIVTTEQQMVEELAKIDQKAIEDAEYRTSEAQKKREEENERYKQALLVAQQKYIDQGYTKEEAAQLAENKLIDEHNANLQEIEEQVDAGLLDDQSQYQKDRKECVEHYTGLLETYAGNYQAAQVDAEDATREAYVNTEGVLSDLVGATDDDGNTTFSGLYNQLIEKDGEFFDAVDKNSEAAAEAFKDFDTDVADVKEDVGTSLDGIMTATELLTSKSDALAKKVQDDVVPALQDELNAVQDVTDAYASQRAEIQDTITEYENLVKHIASALAALQAYDSYASGGEDEDVPEPTVYTDYQKIAYDNYLQSLANEDDDSDDSDNQSTGSNQHHRIEEQEKDATVEGKYTTGKVSWYNNKGIKMTLTDSEVTPIAKAEEQVTNTVLLDQFNEGTNNQATAVYRDGELFLKVPAYTGLNYLDKDRPSGWYQVRSNARMIHEIETYGSNLSSFDTGGYTGDWGTDGKIAMLHQKELVLNADDTSNMLRAVELLRAVTQSIDLNSMAAMTSLSPLTASSITTTDNSLNQNVTISAEFPNATDRDEISAAFDNLINRAAQYARRTY